MPSVQYSNIMRPVPADLAGFQWIEAGTVQNGDLLISTDTKYKAWATISVGCTVTGIAEWFRVYRRIEVPRQGGLNHENPLAGVTEHHSAFGLDAARRKSLPLTTGVLDYFPDALLEVAKCSKAGNDQHNPGKPLHWDRSKSGDEADALGRHLLERGKLDSDGIRHTAKVAWRALAMLQKELEAAR